MRRAAAQALGVSSLLLIAFGLMAAAGCGVLLNVESDDPPPDASSSDVQTPGPNEAGRADAHDEDDAPSADAVCAPFGGSCNAVASCCADGGQSCRSVTPGGAKTCAVCAQEGEYCAFDDDCCGGQSGSCFANICCLGAGSPACP